MMTKRILEKIIIFVRIDGSINNIAYMESDYIEIIYIYIQYNFYIILTLVISNKEKFLIQKIIIFLRYNIYIDRYYAIFWLSKIFIF